MKIQTLEISNFKGMKKFKIENLPDIVVLTGGSGVGKIISTLGHILFKRGTNITDRTTCHFTSSVFQSHELVHNNSNTCEIFAKFELAQSDKDYLRGKHICNDTSSEHEAFVKLNKEGQVIEERCSEESPYLLGGYEKYSDDCDIDRFDCIGSTRNFRFAQNGVMNNTRDPPLRPKRVLSMQEKSIRLKENLILAGAKTVHHSQDSVDNDTQVTKEDLVTILEPFQKIFNDIKFSPNFEYMKSSRAGQIIDIDKFS